MVRSGLKKYHPGKKEYFRPISESYLTGVFLINYGEPLYKHISKLKYFPNPLDITQQSGTQSISCCMQCVTRSELVKKKNEKMSQEVKKEPFAAFFIESSLQAFQYFQKPTWFYLLTTKDILMGKVCGKTFSNARCLNRSYRDRYLRSGEKRETQL